MNSRRAVGCHIVEGQRVGILEFTATLKEDWERRAKTDPTLYVMAETFASEEKIQESGKCDYEAIYQPRTSQYVDREKRVLELGCGIGRMSYFIAQSCKELIAVDIAPELLKIASERLKEYSNTAFVCVDGFSLHPVGNNSIDLVFEYIVFQHIGSTEVIASYIREIARVLKVGGVAVLHGRDLQASNLTDSWSGNTWHGVASGHSFYCDVLKSVRDLEVVSEEGVGTDKYWITLKKV